MNDTSANQAIPRSPNVKSPNALTAGRAPLDPPEGAVDVGPTGPVCVTVWAAADVADEYLAKEKN